MVTYEVGKLVILKEFVKKLSKNFRFEFQEFGY